MSLAIRLLLLSLCVVSIWAVALGGTATAHEVDPDIMVELDDLPDALQIDGLSIGIVTSIAPQLAAENTTDELLEVLDDDGVPFLRIGQGGVEANLDAGQWYLTNDPLGALAIPERARSDGLPPAWGRIATEPSWGWFDHRIHPRAFPAPTQRTAGQVLGEFTIPVRYDGQDADVTGRLVVSPATGFITSVLLSGIQADDTSVTVLPGVAPGLFLDHRGTGEVIVLGQEGEPFLRFSPEDGTQANPASPTWQLTGRTDPATVEQVSGATVVPADPDQTQWTAVSGAPRFGWLDPRGIAADREPPPELQQAGIAVDLQRWDIPILIEGQQQVLQGVTRWVPLAAADDRASGPAAGTVAVVSVAVLAGLGLLLIWRRGDRHTHGTTHPSRTH